MNARFFIGTPLFAGLVFLLSLSVLAASFHWAIKDLMHAWDSKEYGHSYILPLLALWMALHRMRQKPLSAQPSKSGLLCVFGAFGLLMMGELAAFRQLAHYGFYLGLLGLCLAFLGRKITKQVAPAWILLLFAIPFPLQLSNVMAVELKLLSSSLGAFFLELLNIPVFQDGNVIDLGTVKLQVVDACSGLRYLFPLMSFGFLVAYLIKDRFYKRAIVFLSTIPIAIFLNALRIAVIGITAQWGAETYHDLEGWIVFSLCLAVLWGIVLIFLKTGKGRFDWDFFALPAPPYWTKAPKSGEVTWGVLGLCLLGAALAHGNLWQTHQKEPAQHQELVLFPLELGPWQGRQLALEDKVRKQLDLTEYWLADYMAPMQKELVNLYIAYYARQKVGATIHAPSTCIPAGGWEIILLEEDEIILADRPKRLVRMMIQKGAERQLVYYWFYQRGRSIPDRLTAKAYLFWDALVHGQTQGALIRVITPLAQDETPKAAQERLKDFLAQSLPSLDSFLPPLERLP
ncbi:MAG: VPLPA-CTERM-specific exosortase XrtD [Alphaproteobacteria bacterium]|nr:VPLPA-CTERM-specific exosortase XrtD [Alphaproteobacteria bacterium]